MSMHHWSSFKFLQPAYILANSVLLAFIVQVE
jgi:hypothetical protein